MRIIMYLSDLHFGRTRPDLLDPLIGTVNGAAPDLVVVSGDLTQRARVRQFREARALLDRIEAPCLVVPGNHDTPLDNIPLRLFGPWRRYRRWIGENLERGFRDDKLSVRGVNTANPLNWQRGRINRHRVARICSALDGQDAVRTHIVVAHHSFAHAPEEQHKALMRGAVRALAALAGCGADVVLSGHLHTWRAEPSGAGDGQTPSMLLVQAGTGLSTRVRSEENDFNLLRVPPGEIAIERFAASHDASGYLQARSALSAWAHGVAAGGRARRPIKRRRSLTVAAPRSRPRFQAYVEPSILTNGVVRIQVTRDAGFAVPGRMMAPLRFQRWCEYGSKCWRSSEAARE